MSELLTERPPRDSYALRSAKVQRLGQLRLEL